MKVITGLGTIIVNTYDVQLKGKAIYSKIIEIDLEYRTSLNSEDLEININNVPSCSILTINDWENFVDNETYTIYDLDSIEEWVSLFNETTKAFEEYSHALSMYFSNHNKFPIMNNITYNDRM